MQPLVTDGAIYPKFTSSHLYSDHDKGCIQKTVEKILSVPTTADKPGMLLGKIQSGKTKTFLGVISLAFDNGFDIAIILTKGTKALAKQTLARVNREFKPYRNLDLIQTYDIMYLPPILTGYQLNQKLIFVVKKQADNMDRLMNLFTEDHPELASKRVLIIDDEADYASIGFRRTKQDGIKINTIAGQIDDVRKVLPNSSFLQVTATPYSLYLQPENLEVNGYQFQPIRPAFTELVPVHGSYIGGEYYFDQSDQAGSIASHLYQQVSSDELKILHHEDRRSFKVEECLTSDAIPMLRNSICNFIVGGCIRRLQDQSKGSNPKKYSFLVHTEAGRASHAWQEDIVVEMYKRLKDGVQNNPDLLGRLFTDSYHHLSASIKLLNHPLPPLIDVLTEVFNAIHLGWLMVTKVNSERQVEEMLDEEGQLCLRNPLNIFIGGQILDRGVTIANLIGFYYGRKPTTFQQDTVLQHSRMFGFRPIEDLTVTRFYTEPGIYDAMVRMHEGDIALREIFEKDPHAPVVFVQKDGDGKIIPCSPNKILVSNTTTLRPFKRILPVGFQTDYQTRVAPIVKEIDDLLEGYVKDSNFDEPFIMPFREASKILNGIRKTIIMEKDQGYDFDWKAAIAALKFMSDSATNEANRGNLWVLVRKNRNISRKVSPGSHAVYSDNPDTYQNEGSIARRVAIDLPMLILIRQNGLEDKGWMGTPFYWPVIVAQDNVPTTIFAHETAV